jgi:GDP-L-fucose synthase
MNVDFLVAGGTGLVGSALVKELQNRGSNVLSISSKDVDLRQFSETLELLKKLKPKVIIDAAAKVGGIKFNNEFPVEFLIDNLSIQNNLIRAAHEVYVEKFVFLGSSCIYPKNSQQPIKEEYLMTGKLEETNSAYATAKICGVELIKSYRKQFNYPWISLMPCNVYGPNDNFHSENSHVVPALIRRFLYAQENDLSSVVVWGTGTPRREFIYSEDLANAILFCLDNYNGDNPINIGSGKDVTIFELAHLIADIVNFKGKIEFNAQFPDGTPRKLLDVTRLRELGFVSEIDLRVGLTRTINWFKNQLERE